jgi:hypothetical protein
MNGDRFTSCIDASKAFDAQLADGNYPELSFNDVAAIHVLIQYALFNPQHDQADYGKLTRKQEVSGKQLRVTMTWLASILRCSERQAREIMKHLEEVKVITRHRGGFRGNTYVTSVADFLNRLYLDTPSPAQPAGSGMTTGTVLRKPRMTTGTVCRSHTEKVCKEEEYIPEAVTDLRSPSAPSGTNELQDQTQEQDPDVIVLPGEVLLETAEEKASRVDRKFWQEAAGWKAKRAEQKLRKPEERQ